MPAMLAWIVPIDMGNTPTHPIAPGGQPPGTWGGASEPFPGYGLPPATGIWPSPGYPAHPIAPGGRPPGIWGGGNQPFPTPPIVIPPGGLPPGFWGGSGEGFPTHPIAPGGEGEGGEPKIEWKTAWSPTTGWIVVGIPNVDHAAPATE